MDHIHSQETIYPTDAPSLEHIWNRIADNSPKLRSVESAEFSPDGEQIACGDEAFYVTVWDAATSEQVAVLEQDAGIDGLT